MSGHMNDALVERTAAAVKRFCGWLDRYGETSYDHQSFFASKPRAKRQSSLLPQALAGNNGGGPHDFL